MIEARSLTKVYGGKAAVDGIDFQVKPGVVTGFLGPNGAGKSTTMRMILGLDLPTSGTVTVNGRSYRGEVWPLHEVGALLDARAVHPGRSAYNHLHSLAAANGIARARVDKVLEMVGLTSVARKRAGGFSLGMYQRLGIAGALLGDPETLMFDEPVNGLVGGYPNGSVIFAPCCAAYALGMYGRRSAGTELAGTLWGAAVMLVASVALAVGSLAPGARGHPGALGSFALGAMVAASGVLGYALRTRRDYVAELRDRAARLEATEGERAARAIVDERLRIARELHDVIGHSISLIAIQSEAAARSARSNPDAVLDAYVAEALRAGASGFLLKEATADQLTDAVRVIASGEAILAPSVTRRLLEQMARDPAAAGGDGQRIRDLLSAREVDVLLLVARGLSNAEIGATLHLAETTVKSHVQSMLGKLGVRDRLQAAVAAYDAGLVRPRGS